MKKTGKNNNGMKKIKILVIVLAIVLVSMVSFFGIYKQDKSVIANKVKDYQYAMDIDGTRIIKLQVNTGTKELIKDTAGNIIDSATAEEIESNGYIKEQQKINSDESLTLDNYKTVKKLIENRLKSLSVQNYNIILNEETGEIILELPEDDNVDKVIANLYTIGKFEIIDTETKEVLLDNSHIKSSDVLYSSQAAGTQVYLEIAFTKEGKSKLEEISRTYVSSEEHDHEHENTTAETASENEVTAETTTTDAKTTEKQITMKIDDQEIMTTSFEEPVTTGKIQLSVGSATTETDTLQDYVTQAQNVAVVLDSGKLPITYDLSKNEYVLSTIAEQDLTNIEIAIAVIVLVGMIILIAKYKTKGLLAGIAYIGLLAVYMLLVRYTNVVISIESIFGILAILVLNYIFTNMLLKNMKEEKVNKATGKTYKEFFIRILPICIMVIVFCFIKWIPISSFGMIGFWGLTLIAIYNVAVTRTLLKLKENNK